MRIKNIVGAVAVAALVGAFAAPAGATVTGATAFNCRAHLPAFPTASGSGGSCNAVVGPNALGVGAGLDDNGDPYVAAGLANFSASIDSYSEGCTANGLPPALGTASGSASASGLTVLPDNASGTLSIGSFGWTRVGLVAIVQTSPATITWSGGSATAAQGGLAAAAFAPILGAGNVCPEGSPLDALVVGAAVSPV